jgi:hypothetical protein
VIDALFDLEIPSTAARREISRYGPSEDQGRGGAGNRGDHIDAVGGDSNDGAVGRIIGDDPLRNVAKGVDAERDAVIEDPISAANGSAAVGERSPHQAGARRHTYAVGNILAFDAPAKIEDEA